MHYIFSVEGNIGSGKSTLVVNGSTDVRFYQGHVLLPKENESSIRKYSDSQKNVPISSTDKIRRGVSEKNLTCLYIPWNIQIVLSFMERHQYPAHFVGAPTNKDERA